MAQWREKPQPVSVRGGSVGGAEPVELTREQSFQLQGGTTCLREHDGSAGDQTTPHTPESRYGHRHKHAYQDLD